ncbi:hypothetical protein [Bradyrhizobium sp. LHD-71]|uniref:hypothetical protein n=1 Tax=Bradyrhizobium sp. LHD-71 TaxID=3072141 RepID=UPI00280ED0EE|nr:hypothetical protein [Bradyrhizobium sp. LHD-71]MDQ8732473.1 hypothetical protein [Bradyrhizobium sp. LHD-71]
MPKGMVAAIIAALLTSPAAAQVPPTDDTPQLAQRGGARPPREAVRAASALSEAAMTYIEIIELTLADRASAVRLRLNSARGELNRLRPMVSAETFSALEGRLADAEVAENKGDLTGAALAAAEAFKVIVTTMPAQLRRTPLPVSLHTYSAFKLVLLASAAEIDWPAVGQAARESEKSWIQLRRLVRDTNLRVLLSEIQNGLREAVTRKDAAGVRFGAQLQIASTAVLRDFFARFARAMGRGR